MNLIDILHVLGAASFLGYAVAAILRPHWSAKQLDFKLESGRGVSEVRVQHGGFLLALALFALYVNTPLVYQALGWASIDAAVVRYTAYFADRPKLTPTYIAFLLTEPLVGIFLLL